jgi:uncharacterized membrane protein
MTSHSAALFFSVFLACSVETVEAVTIVLAAGTARQWKSTLQGVFAALLSLSLIIVVLGPAITSLPFWALRTVVGGLLLVFGLQWLRKAILRASGHKAMHDEELIFAAEVNAAKSAEKRSLIGVDDWYAFTLSFKGVLLEGLEVVFLVLTFGAIQGSIRLASLAALTSVIIVAIFGVLVHKPLSRVPENTLKYIVGIMTTAFGIFWGAEGSGIEWPGNSAALLGIVPALIFTSFILIELLKKRTPAIPHAKKAVKRGGIIKNFALFWYDFIIGDDWRIAAVVATSFLATHVFGGNLWLLIPAFVVAALAGSVLEKTKRVKPARTL